MKKYLLRNGLVVLASGRYSEMMVVENKDAKFEPNDRPFGIGQVIILLAVDDNPVTWEGGSRGKGFDVIKEIK